MLCVLLLQNVMSDMLCVIASGSNIRHGVCVCGNFRI